MIPTRIDPTSGYLAQDNGRLIEVVPVLTPLDGRVLRVTVFRTADGISEQIHVAEEAVPAGLAVIFDYLHVEAGLTWRPIPREGVFPAVHDCERPGTRP